MDKTIIYEKYGMVSCPTCDSHGYIQIPKRRCCPKCGGFGFIKKEPEKHTNISSQKRRYVIESGD